VSWPAERCSSEAPCEELDVAHLALFGRCVHRHPAPRAAEESSAGLVGLAAVKGRFSPLVKEQWGR
jgi:hypothetical protein